MVRAALKTKPGWVIAKGGITSHDVAVHGLGIRRAEVLGQLLPGMISVLRPTEADPDAIGMPYVVFAGNVGDEGTLADVVERVREAMLATGTDLLARDGTAVAAITTYTLESTRAIVLAAERTGCPCSCPPARARSGRSGASRSPPPRWPRRGAASVPVGVHLDHCTKLEEIEACIALGYSSVMFDGSHQDYEDNVA